VEVVVARIKFGFAGAATGASVGASVTVGASVAAEASVAGAGVGVAAEPQADNAIARTNPRVNKKLRVVSFIFHPYNEDFFDA
jgi:hypothetical protein